MILEEMKMKFETAALEILEINIVDVVTTSDFECRVYLPGTDIM